MAKKTKPKKTKKKAPAKAKTYPKADGIPVYCSHTHIVDTNSLRPNPRNPNHHPGPQVEALAEVIKRAGWRLPIVVSTRSGLIVKGHCRLMSAQLLGKKKVPVDLQDYASEAAEHADLIADYRIPELSEWDMGEAKDLLESVDTGEIDVAMTGYSEEEIEAMMTAAADIDPGAPDPGTAAKSGKPVNHITLEIPMEHIDAVCLWLANGEEVTAEGMGKGVLKRAELIT